MMNKKSSAKQTGKRWVHPPSSLTNGHVVYNVKLLGHMEVDQPKGAEVVREAVRKLKFAKQLKRAEGEKPPKVELTISSMGVTIQDRQSKVRLETFPLHRISYCADDKQDKRICAFICKQEATNKNVCYVMDSEKCAEEITLTVGQAFDLAYQHFLQTTGKSIGSQVQALQKKVRELETENTQLRMRIVELEARQGQQPPPYSETNSATTAAAAGGGGTTAGLSQPTLLKDLMASPSQPPPLYQNTPPPAGAIPPLASPPTAAAATVGAQAVTPTSRTSDAATTNGVASGEIVQSPGIPREHPPSLGSRGRPRSFTVPACTATTPAPMGTSVTSRPRPHGLASPSSQSSAVPSLAPPPSLGRARRSTTGATPVSRQDSQGSNSSYDPFGQAPFNQPQTLGVARSNPFLSTASSGSSQDLDVQHFQELQEGFASGLTIGNADLSLADLDPLKNLSSC
ncbi:PTB domain-containing engulfment adapter protein 1-like isoform X2 [Acanthaster planci]|uniref:PTB domain-containing engulfment adapter protein 1-like isoform X2 n=1 Tax=Acanthaster planci TaxID=133434 RepID=A0A8B7Y760_ACAPL|nr:PTB domain-containing engulfment adapter protein 1-like isoform X2 [Acanthaster planci]